MEWTHRSAQQTKTVHGTTSGLVTVRYSDQQRKNKRNDPHYAPITYVIILRYLVTTSWPTNGNISRNLEL